MLCGLRYILILVNVKRVLVVVIKETCEKREFLQEMFLYPGLKCCISEEKIT